MDSKSDTKEKGRKLMEELLKKLEAKTDNLVNRVNDLETMRNPDEIIGKVLILEQELDEIKTAISDLNIKLNAYVNTDKYIELFSDEEFKELYMNSGFVAKDVAKLIEKKFKDQDTSAPAISKIINGQIGSLELRSYLGKQFRYEIARNK